MSIKAMRHSPEDCRPVAEILGRVGDKWTILVLSALGEDTLRFKDLHRAVEGISQRMLTVTLRQLERDGMLVRTAYPTIPPQVDYRLSDAGRSFERALFPVAEWALSHREQLERSRQTFDANAAACSPAERQ